MKKNPLPKLFTTYIALCSLALLPFAGQSRPVYAADTGVSANQLAAAQIAYDNAKARYDEGSAGFFTSVQATDALEALANESLSGYIKKGDVNDATSLENMKKSLAAIAGQEDSPYFDDVEPSMTYIEKCNYLRAKNSAKELMVTDYLMAVAQADCNYSDQTPSHSTVFNVAENLAWNYGTDPFAQWYDEEYQDLLAGNSDGIGHYKNIIQSSYQTTGFAICTRGTMNKWITYGQTFSSSSVGTAYTLTEYTKRFMTYYNSVTETLKNAENQLNAIKEAIAKAEAEAQAAKQQNASSSSDSAGNSSGTTAGTSTSSTKSKKTQVTLASGKYTITSSGKTPTVTYVGPANKNKTVLSIPATVKIKGKTYKVTAISKNAYKNNKKLKQVTIGKNIRSIGAKAFYGCKSLKKITIKTKSLKTIGSKAFQKIHKKASFQFPKGKKKSYQKLLKKSKSL